MILKKADSVTIEELIDACEFEEVPDCGYILEIAEVIDDIERFHITDYDGFGFLMIDDRLAKNSSIDCHNKRLYISDEFIISLNTLYDLFKDNDRIRIRWYDK